MRIFVTIRYGNEYVSVIKELILVIFIGVLILWWIRKKVKHNLLKANQWRKLRIFLQRTYPILVPVQRILFFLVAILTGASIAASAFHIAHAGTASIALALDQAKFYEAAERVYCLVPDKSLSNPEFQAGCSTIANWKTKCKVESNTEIKSRNSAIAKVFGINSTEMAGRYDYIAITFCYEDKDDAAIYWSKQSAKTYSLIGFPRMAASSIARLALIERDNEKAYQYFVRAFEYSNKTSDEFIDSNMLFTLAVVANSFHDSQAEIKIKQRRSHVMSEYEKSFHEKLNLLQQMGNCWYFILAIWLATKFSRLILVELLARKLKSNNSIEALSNLVTLEIYRNNLQRADQHSKELLHRINRTNK